MASSAGEARGGKRKQILEEGAADTTLHGLGRVVGDRHPVVKLIWLLAFLALVALLCVQFVLAIKKLQSLPVSTSVEPNSVTFRFPDVHFCSYPMISASYPFSMGAEAKNFTLTKLAKIVQLLGRVNESSPYFVALALVNSLPSDFLSRNFGMRKEQSIVTATVMPMNVELELDKDIVTFGHYKHLNCFRVSLHNRNISQMLGNVLAYMDIILYADATYNETFTLYDGKIDSRGLQFSGYEALLGSGFQVYFTPQYGYPSEFTPSVTIAPGFSHYIKLDMRVTNWSEEKGECLNNQPSVQYVDLSTTQPVSYHYNLHCCYAAELTKLFADELKSNVPGTLPTPYSNKDVPNMYNFSVLQPNVTDAEILEKVIFMRKMTSGNLTRETSQFMLRVQELCENKYSCSETFYEPRISSIRSPLKQSITSELAQLLAASSAKLSSRNYSVPGRDWLLRLFNESTKGSPQAQYKLIRAVSENFLRVQIQAGELSSTEVNQTVNYKFFDLTVEIGSLLSLFIGGSLLSLLEIVELCFYLVLGRRLAAS